MYVVSYKNVVSGLRNFSSVLEQTPTLDLRFDTHHYIHHTMMYLIYDIITYFVPANNTLMYVPTIGMYLGSRKVLIRMI